MVTKHKLYKIAVVSIALVLMVVSIAGAFPFSGRGCDSGYHSCNDNSYNKASDSNDKERLVFACPECPACNCPSPCQKCPDCICPTCPVPSLHLDKTGVLANFTFEGKTFPKNITYNYTITNTGNVPLSELNLYDNKTSPHGMAVTVPTILNPSASTQVNNVVYTGPFPTTFVGGLYSGNVTNEAYETAIGSGVQVISNRVIMPMDYSYTVQPI